MTIKNDVVLWDNGNDKLSLFSVPIEQQYNYIDGLPCVTFGISYENADFKGYDVFTLFDRFYIALLDTIKEAQQNLKGTFRIDDNGAGTDGYIEFKMSGGKLAVNGQLGPSFSTHSLIFEFKSDQTMLTALTESLDL